MQNVIQNRIHVPDSYTSVYYDAWANDNHEDPLLSLIYAAIRSGQSDYTPERERSLCNAALGIVDLLAEKNISTTLQALRGNGKLEGIQKETEPKKFGSRVYRFLDSGTWKPACALY